MFMTSWALLYTFAQKKSNLKCMSIKYWRFFVWTCQRKCFTLDLFYMWRKFHLKGRRCWKCKVLPHPKSSLHIWIWQLSYFSKWDAKFSSHCNLETQLEKQFQSLSHDDHHHMFVSLSLNFMEPFPRVLIIKQFSTWLKFIIFLR